MAARFAYPDARRDDSVVEDHHGVKIADPYRWLEDPDSEETKAFVDAQNAITDPYLRSYEKKNHVNEILTNMWNYPKYGCPYKRGKRYFYNHNSGLQNQSVTYMSDGLDGEHKVFIDPNLLSEDGTVAVANKKFTKDGSLCALSFSSSGSDWREIKFIDVESGDYLPDVLTKAKFSSLLFTPDKKGFFYNTYLDAKDESDGTETDRNENQKVMYHRMGTPQADDFICTHFPEHPKWMFGVELSDCENYLILSISESCERFNHLYYFDIRNLGSDGITGLIDWVKLIDRFDAEYDYVTNEGTVFTFKTSLNAVRYKLINIDFSKPETEHWTTLVAEEAKDVLEYVGCVNNDKLVLIYMHDVKNVMYLHDLATGDRLAEFPLDLGSIGGMSGRKEDTEIFYSFTSFLSASCMYRCDLTKEVIEPKVFRETVIEGIDIKDFVTEQVFYPSKDGTKIPMFIVSKKDLPRDSNNPVWLYGYGGFDISLTPYFSVARLLYLKHFNGIFALANIRGGGEYGKTWHEDGMLAKKQNCFDDFCAAAEYFIEEKYTKASRIAISGGSNGGLLVAACLNQRPELFGAGIAEVGVLDMLRFHKFTIGLAWTSDYGCADIKEQFEYIIKYSPLHNVTEPIIGQYPSLLLKTADHDDRVVPLHSLKYIATVQHIIGRSDKQTNPLIISVSTKAGHGAGKPLSKIIEETTDKFCFLALTIGLQWTD